MKEFVKALVCGSKSNLIPEKYNLFGQFVGEWDFKWIDGRGTEEERQVKGEWIFQWILEGTAIQDVFICPSRIERRTNYQPDAAYGTTVRMYNPDSQAWDILYTELGGATQLEARKENDKIVLRAVGTDGLRWVFSEITKTSFHWQRLVSEDGQHWTAEADLYAVRRE